jgi:hypothetical protein
MTEASNISADGPARNAALLATVERERSRLMQVEAVLHCVVKALDDGESDASVVYVIELARELVNRAIDGLDSVHLRPLLEQIVSTQANKGAQIKEFAARYAC